MSNRIIIHDETELCLNTFQNYLKHRYPTLFKLSQIRGVYLCGGFLRDYLTGVEPKDADFFFTSEVALDEALDILDIDESIYVTNYNPPNYNGIPIQLVHKEFPNSPVEIIDSFDFTCTQFFFDGGYIFGYEQSFLDVKNKWVEVNVITKPLSSLNRLVRYAENDWNIVTPYNYILNLMREKGDVCIKKEKEWYNEN